MSELPRRAVTLLLDLQADSKDALLNALENIITHIDRGELTKGCSGGYDAGYTYEYAEAAGPSHDEYVEQLKAWKAERSAPPQGEAQK